MQTLSKIALVICTAMSIAGCSSSPSPFELPEGGCVPTGPDMDDYTEANAFCEDVYCPQLPRCQNKVVTEAVCPPTFGAPYSVCTCVCCDAVADVGGTAEEPVVWEEVYSCLLDSDPPCEQDTRVQLELVQTGQCKDTIEWKISGTTQQYAGTIEGNSFAWTSVPGTGTPEEAGCWEFSADDQLFNKLSGGTGFDCIGRGTRGEDSEPGTTATCAEIAAADIDDFAACPPAPPARPLD